MGNTKLNYIDYVTPEAVSVSDMGAASLWLVACAWAQQVRAAAVVHPYEGQAVRIKLQ